MTAELIKLRNFERTLAKAQTTCLERLDQHEGTDLLDFFKDLEAKRKEELYALRCKMVAIYKPLYKIKDNFKKNNLDKIDLKDLKEEMLHIQKNIETLKKEAKERLDDLKNEEIKLSEEVSAYEDKAAEWEKPVLNPKDFSFPVPKRISTSANNLCQEAKDFSYFVAKSGGHENGWSVEDHRLFIKFRNNSKTIEELVQNLRRKLPDISEEEIKAHEDWYKKYLQLKKKQKAAIEAWRSTKNAVSNNTRKCVSAPSSRIKTRFPSNKTTKQEIAAWKEKREGELKKALEGKHLEKIRQKELNEQKRKKNEELKKEINQWKNSKLFKLQTEKLALEMAQKQERAFKAAQANRLIKQFQSQDDVYIQKKKTLHVKGRTKSEERIQPKVVAPRDPERVLKPTKNWLCKLKHEQEPQTRDMPVCSVRNIERLHFPEWRKGIL